MYVSNHAVTCRRLRDRLIGDEHYELARDVSTKCGIDVAGVWVSWGKALLKFGDFSAARRKFEKVLNVCHRMLVLIMSL